MWNLIGKRQCLQADNFYKSGLKKRSLAKILVHAEQAQQTGSLVRKATQFRRERIPPTSVRACYRVWRHRFEQRLRQKKIIECLRNYSSNQILGQVFAAMGRIAKEKRQKRLQYEPMIKTIRRRQARRIRTETFALMVNIAH